MINGIISDGSDLSFMPSQESILLFLMERRSLEQLWETDIGESVYPYIPRGGKLIFSL